MSNPPKSTKLKNRKEYKQFNRFLDTASNRTKENENKRKTYQTNLNHFRAGLISRLRGSNKLLEKMYVKEIVSGNYFDCPMDLKYHETNLNIILKVPFGDTNSVTVEKAPNKPGYCRICVDNTIWKQHETDPLAIEFHNNFLHKNNHLRVNEFTTWFECIFNEYFTENAYELEIGSKNQSETVKFSISKPVKSVTGLFIEVHVVDTNTRFSVAISLGMEFDRTVAFCQSKIPASITEKWVAVAKPHKNQNDVDWLCSFYTIERKILQCNPKTGSLIRICKQFCCAANIPNISTYLLENIFLREIVKQENAKQFDFWKSSLASLFLHMFNIILHSLNDKSIPYFWDGAVNLAVKLPHKKIYDELVIHRTELDHKINSSDPNVNFDDLFFKIEDQGNNNSTQIVEIANSSTPSTKSMVNGLLNFLGRFSKADCNPAENGVQTSPAINNTESTSNSNIDPIYVRESSSESQSSQSSLSAPSPMSSLVEVIKKPNKSGPLDGLSPKSTKLENYKEHGKFNKFLDTISNQMKQNENHRKTFQTYMNIFMSGLLKKLRANDKLFDKMCTGHVPSGYFFDEPTDLNYDEYNMTVLLKLPCDNRATIDVAQSPKKRGYCRLIVNNIPQDDSIAQEFKTKFVNKDNFLRVNEFYEWFNRIVIEYFTSNCNKMEILKRNNEILVFEINGLERSITGITIKIQVFNENILFLINLGVGIEFDQKYAYCNEKFPQYTLLEPWVAISKFDKNVQEVDWLCSFNSIERKILQDKKKVVPLIRIVKQFFNAANISNLSTYLIENIFLWEISKQENARQTDFWTSSLASLVLHMIDVILRCFDKKPIPYYWEQSINLLQNVDSTPIHDKIFDQKLKLEMQLLNADDSESNFDAVFYLNQNDKETNSDDIQEISEEFELISLDEEETKNHREESIEPVTKEMIDLDETTNTNSDQPSCRLSSSSTSEVGESSVNETPSKKPKNGLCASQVLELIGNFIQVTDRKEYIKHYNALIKFFVNELKTDETFKHIFKGEVMAGSYRDGLKIMKPNEFDTILRLNFGNKSNLLVERIPAEPIHCTIRMNECESNAKPYLKKFLDSEGYLLQDAIIVWIHNLFRDKLKPYEINGKIITIEDNSYAYSYSINGPAFTFKIAVLNTDLKFDMDLVPAIPFDFTHWVATRHYSRDSNQIKWIAVPKPPKEGIQRKKRSFTCSYTEMEKDILHDTYQAKNLIRIFKKFRDTQQLKRLKSYFIKTIFLWQFHDTTIAERTEFWSRPLHVIFLDMFKKLLNYIQNRNLPFYWEASYNLFTKTGENKLN